MTLPSALGVLGFPVAPGLPVIPQIKLVINQNIAIKHLWINHLWSTKSSYSSCTWLYRGLRAAPGSCKRSKKKKKGEWKLLWGKSVVPLCCFNVICLNNVLPVCSAPSAGRPHVWITVKTDEDTCWAPAQNVPTQACFLPHTSAHITLRFNRQGDVYKQNTCGNTKDCSEAQSHGRGNPNLDKHTFLLLKCR